MVGIMAAGLAAWDCHSGNSHHGAWQPGPPSANSFEAAAGLLEHRPGRLRVGRVGGIWLDRRSDQRCRVLTHHPITLLPLDFSLVFTILKIIKGTKTVVFVLAAALQENLEISFPIEAPQNLISNPEKEEYVR